MSKYHKNKEEWIGFKINNLEVIEKTGEREFKIRSYGKDYFYKTDTLLCRCICGTIKEYEAKSLLGNKSVGCRGCLKRQLDIGKKFGKLTVVGWHNKKNKSDRSYIIYDCICDCGNIHSIRNETLKTNESSCCPKCRTSSKLTYNPTTISRYYKTIRYAAKARKIEFSISIEYIEELLFKQNNICSLSGRSISFADGTASLDRIDNKIGYIQENIQWVHRTINYMKNELHQSDFIQLCKEVSMNFF